MTSAPIELVAVETPAHRAAARALVGAYLRWVADIARTNYGLSFDIEGMVESDLADASKFFPPTGRFYLVRHDGGFVGVGCLKRIEDGVGEVQRMYVQPRVRGAGAGRALVERLVQDARRIGYRTLRLESLKALGAAHALYRSVGFVEIDPYAENSMKAWQPADAMDAYRTSAVFMELALRDG